MTEIIAVTDLPTALQAADMVADMVAGANAKASRVAPCLTWDGSIDDRPTPTDDQLAEAKLVLLGAVKRWVEAGAGAFSQQTAGPFSVSTDTRQRTGFNLWPSEITDLQAICKQADEQGRQAFSIDTAPLASAHLPWCDLMFNGASCSCGVDIAGEPIYELG